MEFVLTPTPEDVLEIYPRSLPNWQTAFSGGAGLMATGITAPEAEPVNNVPCALTLLEVDEIRPANFPIVQRAYGTGVPAKA